MIGNIDIRLNSQSPNMPINPVFQFRGSPSTFFISNVPQQIGSWMLNKIYVQVSYPDNTNHFTVCRNVGGVWVGTVQSCPLSGLSRNGFTVYADGVDENENKVTGYVLGKADIYVLNSDSSITPEQNTYNVRYYDSLPQNPKTGDSYFDNGVWKFYNGTSWVQALTKTSQLQNDSGFITASQVPTTNYDIHEMGESYDLQDEAINTLVAKNHATDNQGNYYIPDDEHAPGSHDDGTSYVSQGHYYFMFDEMEGWSLYRYQVDPETGNEWEFFESVGGNKTDTTITFSDCGLTVTIHNSLHRDGLILPNYIEGKARDFLFYLDTDIETITIIFENCEADGQTLMTFVSDDEEVFELEAGKTIMMFSEISPHIFLVHKSKLQVVTQEG